MKTPEEWISDWTFDELPSKSLIESIQKDAFDSGRVAGLEQAVRVVSSRTIPPKNPAYTRAIEESVVFLKAEIDRGGKPGENYTCSKNTPLK